MRTLLICIGHNMNSRIIQLLVVVSTLLLFNCSDDNNKGAFLNENPRFKKEDISFTSFSSINLDEYEMSPAIVSFAVDADSFLYLADMRFSNIKVFDPDMNLVRIIGGHGQGPKELEAPWNLVIHNNLLYVYENHKGIKVLDKKGEYVDYILLEKRGNSGTFKYYDDYFICLQFYIDSRAMKIYNHEISRYSPDGKNRSPIVEFVINAENVRYFIPYMYLSVDSEGDIYLPIEPNIYNINRYNYLGEYTGVITRKYEAGFSSDFKAQYAMLPENQKDKDLLDYPPAVRYIYVDDHDLIWVSVGEYYLDSGMNFEVNTTLDIFSKDGEWLYTTNSPLFSTRFVVKHNRLYSLPTSLTNGIIQIYNIDYSKLINYVK